MSVATWQVWGLRSEPERPGRVRKGQEEFQEEVESRFGIRAWTWEERNIYK